MKRILTVFILVISLSYILADEITNTSIGNLSINFERGIDHYQQKNYSKAIEFLNKAIESDQNNSELYAYRGNCYLKEGLYKESAIDIIKALDIDKNVFAYMTLIEFPETKLNLLINEITEIAETQPKLSKWYYYIGKIYYHKGLYREAIENFKRAYDIESKEIYLTLLSDCEKNLSI